MKWDTLYNLSGRVAVVTGASYGLGVTFAQVLADAGADVAIFARSADKLEETRKTIEERGRRCLVVTGDVTRFEDVQRLMDQTVATLGGVDILVNNAGVSDTTLGRAERVDPASFEEILRTDLVGVWHGCRAAGPHMLRQGGGSIINLSSIFGGAGAEHRNAAYFAAKGGVNQLTRLLACEWADRNVRINALAPNLLLSEMSRELIEQSGLDDWFASRTPMRRMGEVDELIGPFLFLASDASSFVTGIVLNVDGGWGASGGYAQLPQPWDDWGELGKPILKGDKDA